VNFYDQVLREIVAAIGAALVVGNGLALMRRRRDAERAAAVMLIAGVAALVAG